MSSFICLIISCLCAEVDLVNVTTRYTPSEEFFNRYVLGLRGVGVVDTWENYGDPQWKIIGALALSWTVVALSLIKGKILHTNI